MASIAKKVITGLIILLLAGAGTAALVTKKLNFGGVATYHLVKNVTVEASAEFDGETIDTYWYGGEGEAQDWQLPDVKLTRTLRTVIYRFLFVNKGTDTVIVTVAPPDLSGTSFLMTGGAILATEQGLQFYNEPQILIAGDSVDFEYTLTLQSINQGVDKNIEFIITAAYEE